MRLVAAVSFAMVVLSTSVDVPSASVHRTEISLAAVPSSWFGQGHVVPPNHAAVVKSYLGEGDTQGKPKSVLPGMMISLRGGRDGKFCRQQARGTTCDSTAPVMFEVVDAGAGSVALKAGGCFDGGKSAPCTKRHMERASATLRIPRIKVINLDHGKIALQERTRGDPEG